MFKMTLENKISLRFDFSKAIDKPQKLTQLMGFTDTWYGIYVNDWPYFTLAESQSDFDYRKIMLYGVSPTETKYRVGTPVLDCLQNLLQNVSCTVKCFPVVFNQLTDWPPCQNSDTANCILDEVLGSKYNQYLYCLKPQIAAQYDLSATEKPQLNPPNNSTMEFQFYLGSDQIEFKNEILTVSPLDFVSNLGGSLGLFIGFSIYNVIAEILQRCIEKLVRK